MLVASSAQSRSAETPNVANPLDIRTREELAEFLTGRTDEEIAEIAVNLGLSRVLETVFAGMREEYDPADGPRQRAVVQWEIQAPDRQVYNWQNVASREGFFATADCPEQPDVTLRVELVTFLQLMAGMSRGIEALSSGRLKLKGDLNTAMEIEAWFGLPGGAHRSRSFEGAP
jgi:SCP-2 sterol transfer family